MEEVRIDIRDVDYEWFSDVRAFLDRDADRYYLPRESVERLGELDEESGDYHLIDGQVTATADKIEVDGQVLSVWGVGTTGMRIRPAERRA